MGSLLIGRTACPECNEPNAHLKESEKCLYRYCPSCGSQYHARTPTQRDNLRAKSRLDTAKDAPTPTQPTPTQGTGTDIPPTDTQPKQEIAKPAKLPRSIF